MAISDRSNPSDTPAAAPEAAAPAKRSGRRRRIVLGVLIAAPLVLLGAAYAVANSPLVRGLIRSRVEEALGCEFDARRVYIDLGGRLIVEGLALRVPGIDGEAGEFLSGSRAVAGLDWSGVLSGDVRPTYLRISGAVLRASQDVGTGEINLAALSPAAPSGGPSVSMAVVPRIDVASARLELGEHVGGNYTLLAALPVRGALTPDPSGRPVYAVLFEQTGVPFIPGGAAVRPRAADDARPPSPSTVLEGSLDLENSTAKLTLLEVDLEQWPASAVPNSARTLWRDLAIRGDVSRTTFSYDPAAGLNVAFVLDQVSMNAPIPGDFSEGPGERYLRLDDVSGTITFGQSGLSAGLSGLVDRDIPVEVRLDTSGLSLNSALTCRIEAKSFNLGSKANLLPFTPDFVRKHFARFSGPDADVIPGVTITRGPPVGGVAAPFGVTGVIYLSNGSAAYERFPYALVNLDGRVMFDTQRVTIEALGRGRTGAFLSISGVVEPPFGEDVRVELSLTAVDVPIDEELHAALAGGGADVFPILFDDRSYAELLRRGLIATPGSAAEAMRLLDEARRELAIVESEPGSPVARLEDARARVREREAAAAAPVFSYKGVASQVEVNILRLPGRTPNWSWDIVARLPHLGVLAREFPIPIVASGAVVNVTRSAASLSAAALGGVSGGTADLRLDLRLRGDGDESIAEPTLRVSASGVPVDDLLLFALPDMELPIAAGAGSALTPETLVRRLGVTGEVSCEALLHKAHRAEAEWSVEVDLAGLTARPSADGGPAALVLGDMEGKLLVGGDGLALAPLAANIRGADASPGDAALGRLELRLATRSAGAARGDGPGERVRVDAALSGLDVRAPVESVLSIVAPQASARIESLRRLRDPEGEIDARVRYVDNDEPLDDTIEVEVSRAHPLTFDALGHRITVEHQRGSAALHLLGDKRIAFSLARASVTTPGEAPITIDADGTLPLGEGDELLLGRSRLNVGLADARPEAPLIAAALDAMLPDAARRQLDGATVRGVFDANLSVSPGEGGEGGGDGGAGEGGAAAPAVSGRILPRSFWFQSATRSIDAADVRGAIEIESSSPLAGEFDGLIAVCPTYTLSLDGPFSFTEAARPACDLSIDFSSGALDLSVRDLLPSGVAQQLEAIDLRGEGPLSIHDARLILRPAAEPARDEFSLRAAAAFSDLSFEVGVAFTKIVGAADILFEKLADDPHAGIDVQLRADSLDIAGFPVTGFAARAARPASSETLVVPYAAGELLGGRLSASAVVTRPAGGGGGGAEEYRVEAALAGARLARLLAAASARGIEQSAPGSEDQSRGVVDGSLSLAGVAGRLETRRGYGAVRISEGDVVRLPLAMPVMQLSSLQIPLGDKLDYFDASFNVESDTVRFEQLAFVSDSMSLIGRGTMKLPDLDLDVRFSPRSRVRLPLLSDLVEAFRDELITVRATGTLREPRFGVEQLETTKRLLASIIGSGRGERGSADPSDADRAARDERERLRDAGRASVSPSAQRPR